MELSEIRYRSGCHSPHVVGPRASLSPPNLLPAPPPSSQSEHAVGTPFHFSDPCVISFRNILGFSRDLLSISNFVLLLENTLCITQMLLNVSVF